MSKNIFNQTINSSAQSVQNSSSPLYNWSNNDYKDIVYNSGSVIVGKNFKNSSVYAVDVSGIINASALYVNNTLLDLSGVVYASKLILNNKELLNPFTLGVNSPDVYLASGDLGIGKTDPLYPLDVSGDINVTGTFRVNGASVSSWIGSGANRVYLPAMNGNVVIGSGAAYTSKLHVVGNINATTGYLNNGVAVACWTASAGIYATINRNVGIGDGMVAPAYDLDVSGSINSSSGLYINGNGIISTSGGGIYTDISVNGNIVAQNLGSRGFSSFNGVTNFGDDIYIQAPKKIYLYYPNTSEYIYSTGTGQNIHHGSINGNFFFESSTGTVLEINKTTSRFNSNLDVSGNAYISGTLLTNKVSSGTPMFQANSCSQSIVISTYTKLIMSNTTYNMGFCYDNTTGRFTPTLAGWYVITGKLNPVTLSPQIRLFIYKNGVLEKYLNVALSPIGTAMVYCNGTTDYLELWAFSAGAFICDGISTNNYFEGYYLRS
jgi:hypothetical protein